MAGADCAIGIDWGTSNLRLFRFAGDGRVLEHREAPLGIMTVQDGNFAQVLEQLLAPYGWPKVLILSGMIGSRQGWQEVPYLFCPAGLADLAAGCGEIAVAGRTLFLVPGLATRRGACCDVLRGEETQILGAGVDIPDGLIIAPGTHSKWVQLAQGRIESFRTFMTGEMFALLVGHSLLARLMEEGPHDALAFAQGVRRSLDDPELLALLFTVRSEGLFGHLPATGLKSYLSGLLIGAELRGGLKDHPDLATVTIIAAPDIGARYGAALALAGVHKSVVLDGATAAARGLWAIAQRKAFP